MAYTISTGWPTTTEPDYTPIFDEDTVKPDKPKATNFQPRTLGETIPFVVGTGRVEGRLFIGGTEVITKTTYHTETITHTPLPYGTTYSAVPTGRQRYTISTGFGDGTWTEEIQVPTTSYDVLSLVGYVLAYDPFRRGYDLIQLEVDGKIVFDAENGIGETVTFRFYGGRQAKIDPLLTQKIGANAGAYQNFVMVFLDGYDSDSPPSLRAVISNAATDQPEDVRIDWTGGELDDVFTSAPTGRGAAYDPAENIIYQLLGQSQIASLTSVYLVVLDLDQEEERYRIPLEDTTDYADLLSGWVMALRGTGHVLVRLSGSEPDVTRIYDAVTGKYFGEYVEDETNDTITWIAGMPFGHLYVFIGKNVKTTGTHPTATYFGVVDITAQTFEVEIYDGLEPSNAYAHGRSLAGSISFFVSNSTGTLYEVTYTGEAWTWNLLRTFSGTIHGIHFDPETGYIVVTETQVGPTVHNVHFVDPADGSLIDTIDSDVQLTGVPLNAVERLWPKPGFALFLGGGDIYLIDIGEATSTLFIEPVNVGQGVFDHSRLVYYEGTDLDAWHKYFLPNSIPGLIDLDDAITDIMSIAGFGPSDLTFVGFEGLSTYGLVIESDTNVQSVVNTLRAVYDFSWCDTGDGFYFKKAGRDGSLSTDIALASTDLVERGVAVESRDEANIRTPSKVFIEYISKDSNYESRPVSYNMPTGVTNSIRTEKYSSPVLMSDADAQQFVTERFFDLQAKRRDHSFAIGPEYIEVLPGDIVSVPSGDITYISKVEEVAIDFRNLAVEIGSKDFQTEVDTPVNEVSIDFTIQAIRYASQYIHLDIPLYKYSDDVGGDGLVQYGVLASRGQGGWSGAVLYRGTTATNLLGVYDQAPHDGFVGVCTTALADMPDPFSGDFTNSVTVRKITGTVASATEAAVMTGTNLCFIGRPGRWEGLGFMTVVDNGDETFTFSDFPFRGWRGTEVYADEHAVGDTFVAISLEWLRQSTHLTTDLDDLFLYKALGIGQDRTIGLPRYERVTGAAETPYACVNLDAVIDGSDIDISWDYRSRLSAWEFFSSSPESGEETLAFEIDILSGDSPGSVVRTLTASTNAVTYTAAQITTDFGGMPSSLTFRVYMMSAAVGRGHAALATITL